MMLRRVAFLLILAAIIIQPLARQAFGVETLWLRDWAMMQSVGLGLVDARFYQVSGGEMRPLDRESVLASHGRTAAYRNALFSAAEVAEEARHLCEVLGPDADIRVVTRQSQRYGWIPGRQGKKNFCDD